MHTLVKHFSLPLGSRSVCWSFCVGCVCECVSAIAGRRAKCPNVVCLCSSNQFIFRECLPFPWFMYCSSHEFVVLESYLCTAIT